MLGKGAETQLRKDCLDAQSAMDQTNLVAALTGATMAQGSGAFKDMFKGLFTKGDTSFLDSLQSVEEAQKLVDAANIMGQDAAPLAQIASGNQLITDASQRGQTVLENLLKDQLEMDLDYARQIQGIVPRYQGKGLYSSGTFSGDRGLPLSKIIKTY